MYRIIVMTVITLIVLMLIVVIVTVGKSSAFGLMSWCQINQKTSLAYLLAAPVTKEKSLTGLAPGAGAELQLSSAQQVTLE